MRTMLIGKTGSGKTTLAQRLNGNNISDQKTQMISYEKDIIDTPGEYIENKFYTALVVTASEAEVIVFVQSALDDTTFFPPSFSSMFLGKKIIGVVTKKDLKSDCSIVENFLKAAGAEEIYHIGRDDDSGILKLKERLEELADRSSLNS